MMICICLKELLFFETMMCDFASGGSMSEVVKLLHWVLGRIWYVS
jgi:hypothetical protein